MISNELLKNKILDSAIHGTLVDSNGNDEWQDVVFSDVIDVRDGTHDSPKYVEYSNYPLVTSKNLTNKGLDFTNVNYLTKEDYDTINQRSFVDDGDILFAMIGSIGNPVIVNKDRNFAIKNVALFKCTSKIYNKFLYYFLLHEKDMGDKTAGGVQKFVSLKTLRNYPIKLPPIEEQKKIVAKVDELFELIDHKVNNDKEKARLKDVLKDKILDNAIHGTLVENDPLLSPVDFDSVTEDIPFNIPSNWKWIELAKCADFNVGKTPSTKDSSYWGTDIHWVSISDMKHRETISSTSKGISSKAFSKTFNNRIVPVGTLLMSFKLTIGRLSITGIECVHNEAIVSLYPKDYLLKEYLLNALDGLDLEKNVKNAIKGKTLNSKSIASILIPIPPLEEQKRIVAKIEECFGLIDQL